MRRILIVYNPHSSRYHDVREQVLEPAGRLSGYMIGKYEVRKTNLDDNIEQLAKLIVEGDLVLAAGGDATGVIAMNAVMQAKEKRKIKAELAALPFGNFNDLARTLQLENLEQVLEAKVQKFYPLEVFVDGKFWRWASCYVTIGMTAEAVKLYDEPEMRQKLKSDFGRKVTSYTALIGWYFKNRHTRQFIPAAALNGRALDPRTSDYAAVNGRYMARVMRGREDFLKPREFRSVTDHLTSFWRLFGLMAASIVDRVPGEETKGDKLRFLQKGEVEVQAEGESRVFENPSEIEVRKGGYIYARGR